MSNENDKGSFWATIPGILTGLAALITAIGGLWLILDQTPDSPLENATPQVVVGAKSEILSPSINYFEADQNSINANDSSALKWSTSDAQTISIDNGIGVVEPNGSRSVSPTSTTTYTLIAKNQKDTVSQNTTVTVNKALTSYEIVVHTGDEWFGGTNSKVNLTLHGEHGEVSTETLDKPGDDFIRGKDSKFSLNDVKDVGDISKIYIHFNERGNSPNWLVDKITITNTKTAKTYVFSINEWLKQSGTFQYDLTRIE